MYVTCTHHRFNEPAVIQFLTIAVFNSKAYSCTAKITVQFLGNSAAVSAGFAVNFTNFGNDVYMMTPSPIHVPYKAPARLISPSPLVGNIAFGILSGQADAPVAADLMVVAGREAVVLKVVVALQSVHFDLALTYLAQIAVVVIHRCGLRPDVPSGFRQRRTRSLPLRLRSCCILSRHLGRGIELQPW